MKKGTLLSLLLGTSWLIVSPSAAQNQVVKMTSSKSVGETITLLTNRSKDAVTIDWGNGVIQTYNQTEAPITTIQGTLQGSVITLTGSDALTMLSCENNGITALDVSGAKGLEALYCQNNALTTLNLTGLTKLVELDVSNNQIANLVTTSSNLSALENLNIANNNMTRFANSTFISSSASRNLQRINIAGNQFANAYFTSNTEIDFLNCAKNEFKTLTVTNNKKLSTLVFNDNQVNRFNMPTEGLPLLITFICDNNDVTTLDFSSNDSLKDISVANNKMTSLLIPNRKMQSLNISGNALSFQSFPKIANLPAQGMFAYVPQSDVDITNKLQYSNTYEGYFLPQNPSYSTRTNSTYQLNMTDFRKDATGLPRVTLTPVLVNKDGSETALELASATNKEQDYTYVSGVFTFLKPFEKVLIKMTHDDYPDLVIRSTPFVIGEENITGINSTELVRAQEGIAYDLQGLPVKNPSKGIFIQDGKKIYIK